MKKFLLLFMGSSLCFGQTLDNTFDTDGKMTFPITAESNGVYDIALQSDGKIVAVGYGHNGVDNDISVARFNADGSIDLTFNSIGYDLVNYGSGHDFAYAVAIQTDGKIVVVGSANNGSNDDFVLLRYNTDGTLDNTFDTDGRLTTQFDNSYEMAYDVVIQADGKIIAAGAAFMDTTYNFAMARYNTNGSLDNTFDTDGKVTTLLNSSAEAKAIILQGDGKIVLAGKTLQSDFSNAFAVTRYNTNGSLDNTFSSDGMVTSDISTYSNEGLDVALQADGKIIVVGKATPVGPEQFAVVRYNTDGTLDNGWGGTGYVLTAFGSNWDEARSVFVQPDNQILVAGLASTPTARFAMARYNPDGSLDGGFGTGGKLTTSFGPISVIWSALMQPDNKILVAGYSGTGTDYDYAFARYGAGYSGVEEDILHHTLSVYPNPVKEDINVNYTLQKEEKITIQLMGMDGKVIATYMENESQEADTYTHQLMLPMDLLAGNYFLVVSSPKGSASVKIVKE